MKVQSSVLLILFLYLLSCCSGKREPNLSVQELLRKDTSVRGAFIRSEYYDIDPLVQLINIPIHTEACDTFYLAKETDLQIYSVGELLYNLPDLEKKYYQKIDDIELFFDVNNDKSKHFDGHGDDRCYYLSFGDDDDVLNDTAEFTKQGIYFKGYSVKSVRENKYVVEIKVPWKNLNVTPRLGTKIGFDIGIGDNDDGFIQSKKIAWSSISDCMEANTSTYGTLYLSKAAACSPHTLNSVLINAMLLKNKKVPWSALPADQIRNVVYGYVKDRFDLSAWVKSYWDYDNLYFFFEIHDIKIRYARFDKVKQRQILVDYGWIENERGEKVWEMNAKHCVYAGGALKNQKIDTVIRLKKGKYYVKYISDESHAFANWNDDPPHVPFSGIVIYTKPDNQ